MVSVKARTERTTSPLTCVTRTLDAAYELSRFCAAMCSQQTRFRHTHKRIRPQRDRRRCPAPALSLPSLHHHHHHHHHQHNTSTAAAAAAAGLGGGAGSALRTARAHARDPALWPTQPLPQLFIVIAAIFQRHPDTCGSDDTDGDERNAYMSRLLQNAFRDRYPFVACGREAPCARGGAGRPPSEFARSRISRVSFLNGIDTDWRGAPAQSIKR